MNNMTQIVLIPLLLGLGAYWLLDLIRLKNKRDQARQAVEHSLPWRFLEASWQSWKTQLYVRGHRLPAAVVWTTMKANELTVEQAADNWNLPVEAIEEIIRYCEQNKSLLEKEAAEELRLLKEKGIDPELK